MTNQNIVTAVIEVLITTKLLIVVASNVQLKQYRFEWKQFPQSLKAIASPSKVSQSPYEMYPHARKHQGNYVRNQF